MFHKIFLTHYVSMSSSMSTWCAFGRLSKVLVHMFDYRAIHLSRIRGEFIISPTNHAFKHLHGTVRSL
jgi:hypothetical protein